MKCYYEELAVSRDANESEIKSAYRKLALKWHPDKNRDCTEEAKERFQLIQQAYEVLSDSQERAWYDNHREQILRGKNSNYEDVCLDVFQYFTVSCFKGYGDDAKGFYAIYREVFKKIAAEDAEFMDYEEEVLNIPEFGNSNSSYEDVVGPFYAHWSAYCTKRTYTWLCPYNIKEIKDRKILREIEKDMKKVVLKAKKERNEEVRNLVSFVRKRDKRVQAYKKLLEERSVLNRQKQELNRLEQIKRRQKELEEMRQNSQTTNPNDDYENKLKELEQQYSSDEDRSESEDESDEQNDVNHRTCNDDLYCVGCNKQFKTERSFANHEMSKKHRDNIEKLKIAMKNEEFLFQINENSDGTDEVELAEDKERNGSQGVTTKNKARKTRHKKEFSENKNKNEENLEQVAEAIDILNNGEKDDWDVTNGKLARKCKNKNKISKNKSTISQQQPPKSKSCSEYVSKTANESSNALESEVIQHICATCELKFQSKNKLFAHLKLTNHGIFIPKANVANVGSTKSKKHKGKVNK